MDFPDPQTVLSNGDLISAISTSLSRQKENGTLKPYNFGQTIKNYITIYYPQFPALGSYEISRWRLQVYERIYNKFAAYALDSGIKADAIPTPGKFDNLPAKLEGQSFLEGVKVFGESFGDEVADVFGTNIEAVRWFFKNMYWIAPLGLLLYFSPQIIKALKEANK